MKVNTLEKLINPREDAREKAISKLSFKEIKQYFSQKTREYRETVGRANSVRKRTSYQRVWCVTATRRDSLGEQES